MRKTRTRVILIWTKREGLRRGDEARTELRDCSESDLKPKLLSEGLALVESLNSRINVSVFRRLRTRAPVFTRNLPSCSIPLAQDVRLNGLMQILSLQVSIKTHQSTFSSISRRRETRAFALRRVEESRSAASPRESFEYISMRE